MRAYREANTNQGTSILTLAEYNAIPAASRSSDIVYIISEFVSGSTTHINISDVYIGNVAQNVLVGNDDAIVWTGNVDNSAANPSAITGFTPPALTTGTPINILI
ncbi:MAG: hypothetical protein MPJ25_05355 [Pirellulales bacterium]|nr:hypothetical protein [Pirellulales bacterium]